MANNTVVLNVSAIATLWCNGSTEDSDSSSSGSNPGRVIKSSMKIDMSIMEITLDNLEPDSESDQPGPRENPASKERKNDFTGCVRGYCKIPTGKKENDPKRHS